MAESKVKRDNFIALQGWMLTDLKLKGNELIVYACIYGFSQAENQTFNGSLQYLADWTNSTKQGVIKCLKSLVEKGYIVKEDKYINGVKFCEYYATKFNTSLNKVDGGMQQSLTGGMQQSLHNNIGFNNTSNNTGNNTGVKKERKFESPIAENPLTVKPKKERKSVAAKNSFDLIIEKYLETVAPYKHDEIRELLQDWLKVRKAKRAAMTDRAIQLNLNKLNALATESNMTVEKYLEEIICRGWTAFYVIKDYQTSKTSYAPRRSQTNGNIFLDIAQDEGII